jgi:hypothetical protein
MPKSVDDFRKIRADDLGKVRNLGLGSHKLPADHIYGVSTQKFKDWGAKECLQGNYTYDEQQPDPDLGRSLRRGCAPEHVLTSERVFGVPCIRQDIIPPRNPSVADSKNYGNEPGAKALLYPQPFSQRGVYEEDFLQGHPKVSYRSPLLRPLPGYISILPSLIKIMCLVDFFFEMRMFRLDSLFEVLCLTAVGNLEWRRTYKHHLIESHNTQPNIQGPPIVVSAEAVENPTCICT